jgi:hypothetical protein
VLLVEVQPASKPIPQTTTTIPRVIFMPHTVAPRAFAVNTWRDIYPRSG